MHPTTPPLVLDTKAAARHLGLAASTLSKLRLSGEGPAYAKLGRRCVYRRSDLEAFIAANLRRSTSDPGRTDE